MYKYVGSLKIVQTHSSSVQISIMQELITYAGIKKNVGAVEDRVISHNK